MILAAVQADWLAAHRLRLPARSRHVVSAGSVAKVRDQPVVIGYLVLARCADTEQRTVDRVSHTMAPRPGGKDVIEAPVRVQADGGEGIAVGPGVAG